MATIPQSLPGAPSKGRLCNCYSSNCQHIGQRYTENKSFPCPRTLIKVYPNAGSEVIVEATTKQIIDNTKLKQLLKQKLQEAKALQQKNLLEPSKHPVRNYNEEARALQQKSVLEATKTFGAAVVDNTPAAPNDIKEGENPPIVNIIDPTPLYAEKTQNEDGGGATAGANSQVYISVNRPRLFYLVGSRRCDEG
jgi:hypothetical protein